MTIDDDNSIYVGGIPYDCTEEDIRRVFDLYGSVIAVKIINARDVGGKCYCFVTFTNPRAAIDAINDMNGRMIGGRVVKVNEVNARGAGRPPPPPFHRSSERDMDWNNRGRERERGGYDHERDRYGRGERNNNADRSQDGYDRPRGDCDRNRDHFLDRDQIRGPEPYEHERNRSHDRDRGKDHNLDRDLLQQTEYERPHDYDRSRDRSLDRDQVRSRDYHERDRSRSRSQDRALSKELDLKRDTEVNKSIENNRKYMDKEQFSRSQSGSHFNDRRSRELSSSSNDNYNEEGKERLDVSTQKHGDLEKKISQIKERLEEKNHLVSELKKKSQKLEDSVASAKRLTSQRQLQLTMLQRCFLQVKDYREKLKNSEQELQSLVETVMADIDHGDEDD
ncbi:hypothetical protein MKW98_019632 [Papaver atlanticum]|uniref:RRM domain-containing protein n=1 Tax=Papaver atlanticum TaxID=357466 RepID=A0AAD4XAA4_9MAGN|nr:hypothetical protein MKW98_019632 [Papaver atlanticum]